MRQRNLSAVAQHAKAMLPRYWTYVNVDILAINMSAVRVDMLSNDLNEGS
jgi:hypothetical protein